MLMTNLNINGEAFGHARFTDDGLELRADAKTDWFFTPDGRARRDNVITASVMVDEPVFSISAQVAVDFIATYDAGALFVRVAEDSWAKLAFEYSAMQEPTIVSVVTRDISDDCDGPPLKSGHVWLRIYRNRQTLAFHYSMNGSFWHFARFFSIPGLETGPVEVGLGVQAPTGPGTVARFTDIRFETAPIDNLRNGQ